jgi:hypothetical protein
MPVAGAERLLPAPIDPGQAFYTLPFGFRALRASEAPRRIFNNLQAVKQPESRNIHELSEIAVARAIAFAVRIRAQVPIR